MDASPLLGLIIYHALTIFTNLGFTSDVVGVSPCVVSSGVVLTGVVSSGVVSSGVVLTGVVSPCVVSPPSTVVSSPSIVVVSSIGVYPSMVCSSSSVRKVS